MHELSSAFLGEIENKTDFGSMNKLNYARDEEDKEKKNTDALITASIRVYVWC